jgi:hypothetical protein
MNTAAMNTKVYIHEFIDIIGHHRADYVHHMTANWSPTAQVERKQLCYGVWAVLGSTGRWPEVVNIWEHDSWDGLAASFGVEAVGRGAQDPTLERWWAKAADFRRGGVDRILEPAPWTRPIGQLCAEGVGGQCYAHELVTLTPGSAAGFLDRVRDDARPVAAEHGWELAGAWRTAMANDDEAILLWSIPSWADWAAFEAAARPGSPYLEWRRSLDPIVRSWQRIVLVDAPLSPFRTRRQPATSDQTGWAG